MGGLRMGLVLVLGDAADWLVRRRRVEMSSVSVREIGGILGRQLLIVAQAGPGVRLMGIGCVSGLFEPPADDLPAGIYLGRVTRIISGTASDDGDNVFANALGGGALPRFVEVSDRLIVEALAESRPSMGLRFGFPWRGGRIFRRPAAFSGNSVGFYDAGRIGRSACAGCIWTYLPDHRYPGNLWTRGSVGCRGHPYRTCRAYERIATSCAQDVAVAEPDMVPPLRDRAGGDLSGLRNLGR